MGAIIPLTRAVIPPQTARDNLTDQLKQWDGEGMIRYTNPTDINKTITELYADYINLTSKPPSKRSILFAVRIGITTTKEVY